MHWFEKRDSFFSELNVQKYFYLKKGLLISVAFFTFLSSLRPFFAEAMDCQIFIVQYNSGMSHSTDAYRSPNDKEIFFARVKWKTHEITKEDN